jgi:hypothetical protein
MSFRNTLLVLLFGGTLGMALLREQPRGTLEPLDRVHREFLKANPGEGRAPAAEHPSIVFARLDDGDLERPVFSTWPLSEGDWQIILQNLPGYEPRVTALNTELAFPKAAGALEGAAKSVRGLCVAPLLSASPGDGSQTLPPSLPVLKVNGSRAAIPEFKSLREAPLPGLAAAGRIDMLPKDQMPAVEGDWCRVPMLARMGENVVPTLALRALLAWADVPPEDVTVTPGAAITAGKALRIEIDEAGFFRFFISLAPPVPAVNADAFVLSRDQSAAHLPEDSRDRDTLLKNLKGGLLWLGLNDVKSRTLREPGGTPVSPSDLTARAIAVIQTNTHLLPLPANLQWITPAVTLFFCVWLTHWRKSRLWPGALVAAIALIGVSLWFYRRDHLWLPLGPSLALVAATLILSYLLPSRKSKGQPEAETRRTMRSTRSTRSTLSTRSVRTGTRPPATVAPKPRDETARDPMPAPPEATGEGFTTRQTEPVPAFNEPTTEVAEPMTVELAPQETEAPGDEVPAGDAEDEEEEIQIPQQIARPQRQLKKGKKKRRR